MRELEVNCPTCNVPVASIRYRGRDIKQCSTCGGMWMAHSDFLTLLRDAQPSMRLSELMIHNDGSPRRPCPVCRELMDIAWIDFLQLNQCHTHGLWLDKGILQRALAGDIAPESIEKIMNKVDVNADGKLTRY